MYFQKVYLRQMTTKQAWLKMINTKGIETTLGITKPSLYYFRSMAKTQKQFPSTDTMEEQLKIAGYKVLVEKQWK